MIWGDAWYYFNFLEFVEAYFVTYHVVYTWKYSMCTEKNVYFASLGWKVLYISIKSIWCNVSFSATISMLIICLEDLSIIDSRLLKSLTICVLLSISFLKFSKIFLIYLGASMLGAYIFTMFMSSWWILPLDIMKCPSVLFMAFVGSLFCLVYCKCIATLTFFFLLSVWLVYFLPIFHFQSL